MIDVPFRTRSGSETLRHVGTGQQTGQRMQKKYSLQHTALDKSLEYNYKEVNHSDINRKLDIVQLKEDKNLLLGENDV